MAVKCLFVLMAFGGMPVPHFLPDVSTKHKILQYSVQRYVFHGYLHDTITPISTTAPC